MNVLVDTGVWYAICDPRDRPDERDTVETLYDSFRFVQVLVPWPVVYETIRTRLSRNAIAVKRLQDVFKQANLIFLDDAPYREEALQMVFDFAAKRIPPRPISAVDCLLRLMLDDANLKIDRFATYNDKDFIDVCRNRTIEMIR